MMAERRLVLTPELREEIERRLLLSAVIGERVALQEIAPRTGCWRGLCPFCGDDFRVFDMEDMTRSSYHCWGCGAHGSLLGFTMRVHNLTLRDAVLRLAEQAETPLEWATVERPETTPEERERFRAEIAALHDPKTHRDGWGRVKRAPGPHDMMEF